MDRHRRPLFPLLIALYLPTLIALAIPVAAYERKGIPPAFLLHDPAVTTDTEFYIGAFSNLGVLLWCAAAAVSLFTSVALRRAGRDRDFSGFLLWLGLLTALLMFDDLFLLHERVFPNHLHVPQPLVLAAYGVIALGGLVGFARTIVRTDYLLLALAFLFLGSSVLVDLMPPIRSVYWALLEDGLKLMGVVSWCGYIVRTCLVLLSSRATATA